MLALSKNNVSLGYEATQIFINLMKASSEIITCLIQYFAEEKADIVKSLFLSYFEEPNKTTDEMKDIDEHDELIDLRNDMYSYLSSALYHENPMVRKVAAGIFPDLIDFEVCEREQIEIFACVRSPSEDEMIKDLKVLLGDKDMGVREAVVESLRRLGYKNKEENEPVSKANSPFFATQKILPDIKRNIPAKSPKSNTNGLF